MVQHVSNPQEIGLDRLNSMISIKELNLQTEPGMALQCSLLQAMWRTLLKSNFNCMSYNSTQYLVVQTISTRHRRLTPSSIPETVFTTNITFILSHENKAGSKKTKTTQIPKDNVWTNRIEKQRKTGKFSSTSLNTTVTSLQKKNEMLQAQINALEEERVSISSQFMTSDSTDSTPAEIRLLSWNLSIPSVNDWSVTECYSLNGCMRKEHPTSLNSCSNKSSRSRVSLLYLTLQRKPLVNSLLSRTALSYYKNCQILERRDRNAMPSRHRQQPKSIRILLNIY